MAETHALLTLALTPGVTARTIRAIRCGAGVEEALTRPAEPLPPAAVASIRSGESSRRADRELAKARERGIRVLGLDEPDYPPLLQQIYDPPPVLYVMGSLAGVRDQRSIAIVGSRRATPRGTALARCMAKDLAPQGVVIVSGLARGIDAAAHRGALDGRGRTFAVLGSGLDRLYPPEHRQLAEAIAGDGAVVTEHAFGAPPYPAHFPRRNRIIAGWSRATVVVEAGSRSGALVTARLALEEGRDVMAVPGWPGDDSSLGTNQLIRDGAALVRCAADVASELGLPETTEQADTAVEEEQDVLLKSLRPDRPASLEELQRLSGWPPSDILSRLMELELGSRVRRLPGPLFVRS